jgi:hypothetical protein
VISCALAGVIGLTIGCTGTKDTKPTASHEDAIKGYKSQLGGFDTKVDELKAKVEKATGDEKKNLEAKLKDATAKREAAKKKLEELEKVAADKWDAVNKEAKTAFEEASKAIKE